MSRITEMITTTMKLREADDQISGCQQVAGDPELDESDEERELTNLNWLLRNQNLSWPKTIDVNSEDDINQSVPPGNRTRATFVENINTQKKQNLLEYGSSKSATNRHCNRNHVSFPDSRKQGTAMAPLKRPSPAERYDIFINKIKRDLAEYEKSANKYKTDVTQKPPFNYSHIIGMAMLENGRVTLQQICAWIESKFAFFRVRKKWNNSIRHNLSLHHCFRNRKREEKGKGGYWELGVDPKKCDRKRIRNRKTTRPKLNQTTETSTYHCPVSKYQSSETAKRAANDEDCTEDRIPSMSYRRQLQQANGDDDDGIADDVHDVQLAAAEQALALTDVEGGLGLALPNMLSPRAHDADGAFLYPDTFTTAITASSEAFHLQQQYELGTIIISTTGLMDEPSCLNSIISNKFGCTNMIYTEDEIPPASENVIIASHKMDSTKDANIALIAPVVSGSEIPSSLTINCDYANFRPYMDGVDEPFNYLNGNEINRNEDILDNLLDVCVRDY